MTKIDDKPKKQPTGDYPVGYCRTPQNGKFVRGQSGNPKGRKKGGKNLKTDVRNTLKEPVTVTINGKKRRVSTQQAMLLRIREQALSGNAKAIDQLIKLAQIHNDEELVQDAIKQLDGADNEILKRYAQRMKDIEVCTPKTKEEQRQHDLDEAWKRSGIGNESDGEESWLQ